MRGSYASHYRRMLSRLLSVLRSRSNNTSWRPILDPLHVIVRLGTKRRRSAPAGLAPPGSIPVRWKGLVLDARGQLNVISYELCVLNQLRERIRAREIWVEGAGRYRNPDQDLPTDFEERPTTPGLASSRMRMRSLPTSAPAWRKSCTCSMRRCRRTTGSDFAHRGRTGSRLPPSLPSRSRLV